jgi:membrane fusion protein, macrolide-specific efflux system
MKSRKIWLYTLLAVVVLGISSALYIFSHPSAPSDGSAMLQANLGSLQFEAAREDLTNSIEIRGKSSYAQETAVYAPFAGDVRSWKVKDGVQVNKGDILFELDAEELNREVSKLNANIRKLELEASIRRAQKGLEAAGATAAGGMTDSEALKRYSNEELARRQEDLDTLQLSTMRSQISDMSEKASQASFSAPESGIFLFHEEKEPQQVEEKEKLGSIVELSKLKLTSTVSEFEVFRIREGMQVDVKVDALKEAKIQGTVESVSKFAKTKTDSSAAAEFEVVVALEPNDRLIAGLSLTGTIETERKEGALVIPTLAVLRDKDEYYVQLQTAQGIERRTVKIGIETADKTEVVEGLQEGDKVVLQ